MVSATFRAAETLHGTTGPWRKSSRTRPVYMADPAPVIASSLDTWGRMRMGKEVLSVSLSFTLIKLREQNLAVIQLGVQTPSGKSTPT